MEKEIKKGGFSKEVWETDVIQDYIKSSIVGGYVGSYNRKAWADKMLEEALKEEGLKARGIATWLTSTEGRHLADRLSGMLRDEWKKEIKKYVKDAFLKVCIWSHPDHDGSWCSLKEIEGRITCAIKNLIQ